ncbi:MAG: trypsin, partial [Actinomyces sp.]
MSGYDETNPEAYRPTEPGAVADGGHSGVDSWSASSQADPATAVSSGEGPTAADNHGGYEDLSQAYAADASDSEPVLPQGAGAQRWDETRQLPAEPPTSQLPAEPSTSLYAQSAQEQYQQSQQQSYQQPQGQYSAPQAQQAAPSSYSSPQQPYQGQQSHFGSPYTSVPTTPGGYAPAGAPSGESFYAASKSAGTENGTTRRRGPGWFALVASVLVAS